jgi:hypothetical protein
MVDWVVRVGLSEVLVVHGPGIVVTGRRVHRNVHSFESLLDLTSNELSVHSDLFISVVPRIMGTIVTSPEDRVNLMCLDNMFKHVL